jgi:hypothetical protein
LDLVTGLKPWYNDSWGWTRAKKITALITLAPQQARIHMRRAARNGKTRGESFCNLCLFGAKQQLWSLVEIKNMMAGAPVAPETLTTKRQGAKSRDGREQEPFRKSILLRTK